MLLPDNLADRLATDISAERRANAIVAPLQHRLFFSAFAASA
jgi:hypothetical protein